MIGDAFFGDTSGLDICIGQEGFDLSAACEANISVEGDLPPEEETRGRVGSAGDAAALPTGLPGGRRPHPPGSRAIVRSNP
jgi:hypothetical protein